MRAEAGAFAADGALAIVGLAVLWAMGLLDRTARSLLGGAGLGYLVGSALVGVVSIALLSAGAPFTLVTIAIVCLACAAIALITGRRLRTPAQPEARVRSRTEPVDRWATIAFAVLLGGYVLVGLVNALELPLDQQDAWSIWTRKAQLLTMYDALPTQFFTEDAYAFMHPDYPLLLPVWEAIHFRAAGVADTQAIHAHLWLLLPAFVWGAAFLVAPRIRAVIWAPVLLSLAAAPGVWQQLLWGFADLPMALFAGLGALALGIWLTDGRGGHLALAAVALMGAASTKNEGLVTVAALLAVTGAILFRTQRRALKPFALAAGGVALTVLPWRIWMSVHGVAGELPVLKGLNPAYLAGRLERVGPSFRAINDQLARQEQWVYLVPMAVLVVAASLLVGVNRRAAVLYAGSAVLVWVLLVWAYWIYPLDLNFLLTSGSDRVVTGLLFICAAAVVHLTGALGARLLRRSG